jgi:hypothetical protein
MLNKGTFLLIGSLILLAVVADKMLPSLSKWVEISQQFEAKKIGRTEKADQQSSVLVESIGNSYLWHVGTFLLFSGALYHFFNRYPQLWSKLVFAFLLFGVFFFATRFFFIADDLSGHLSEPAKASISEQIADVKLAAGFIALFSGGLCFEAFKFLII